MTTSQQLIDELQAKIHEVVAPLMPASGKFVLLDFPDHPNVGDSAIWLGEIAYFKNRYNATPLYVCHKDNYNWHDIETALPEGTIFFHGGGNFGDVWIEHQKFREAVLQRFPKHRIVQMPQSLHFSSPEALQRASVVINAHPDYTILVRDQKSYDIAKSAFTCKLLLCPDMAFCLGSIAKPVQPTHELLLLLRTDHETQGMALPATLPQGTIVDDWLIDDENVKEKSRNKAILQLPLIGFKALNKHFRREKFYYNLANARMQRGLRLLSSAKYVITDRLHSHILSILLNIPHTNLDNNYGKIANFSSLWTSKLDIMHKAQTLDEALTNYSNSR